MRTERQYFARLMRPPAPNRNSKSSSIPPLHADPPAEPAHGLLSLRSGGGFNAVVGLPWMPKATATMVGFQLFASVWCNKPKHLTREAKVDRRSFMAGCAGLSMISITGDAFGESGSLIKMIFPFSAGGGGDALCRLVAQYAGQLLDRTIIVENRTGGDGLIGIKWVRNASPDGTNILVTTGPTMYLLPMVETEPSFDLNKDFVPVSLLARFEFGVVAGSAVGAKDFKQFVAWLKANPGKATFGVPSNGTIPHFAGSKLEQVLGVPLTRVAYRGSAPAINDLIGGHLPF